MSDSHNPFDQRALDLAFYPHRCTIETRSTDRSDPGGHIPNGKIADFGDEGRLGMHQVIVGDGDPGAFKLVDSRFRFFHELRFPGAITIGVGVLGIGNSSLRQVAGIFRDGRCHVLAHFALVKVVNGFSAPLSTDERRRAAKFIIPD